MNLYLQYDMKVINNLKASIKCFLHASYWRVQRRNGSVWKSKALPQMSASKVPLRKLIKKMHYVWLKQDQCIKLKENRQQQQQNRGKPPSSLPPVTLI